MVVIPHINSSTLTEVFSWGLCHLANKEKLISSLVGHDLEVIITLCIGSSPTGYRAEPELEGGAVVLLPPGSRHILETDGQGHSILPHLGAFRFLISLRA